jgi:ribosomal protein S13
MAELGSDISGVRDVDAALSEVSGRTALAQAILRRLRNETGQGMPADRDKDYGYDLREVIGTMLTATQISQKVRAQALAEEEVENCSVSITNRTADSIEIDLRVVDGDGPFELTVSADLLTVELLNGDLNAVV